MAHPSLVESLFSRKRSRNNLSIFSTTKDSDDSFFTEDLRIKLRFNVIANTPFGWDIRVVGNVKELGFWNIKDSLLLKTSTEKYPLWSSSVISLQLLVLPLEFEYKYIMVNQIKNETKWEIFENNREVKCPERTPKNYIHEIQDQFNKKSTNVLKISTTNYFTEALIKIPFMTSFERQLNELTNLLFHEVISLNTLALACIAIKNMKNPVGNDYSSYNYFIEWCSQNITVQQTKILLSATNPTYMWLANPTNELIEKIEVYQEAYQNSEDDIYHVLSISELRMSLLNEYKTSDDIAGLLITDTYLEKNQLLILERIIESVAENEIWKIVMIGMWICQVLFLNCIKPKQTSVMIYQFEKLRKQESVEILRDLLNELLALILDVYTEIYSKVNHQECEAIAALLQSDYKILFNGIFHVSSQYLIKMLPILNYELLKMPFMCYNSGCCQGDLRILNSHSLVGKNILLVVEELHDDFEIPSNVKGLVVIFLDNLFIQSLLIARKNNIPIAIGYFPPITEGEYILNINEDCFTIQRAWT